MSTPRARIVPLFIPHAGCPHDCVFCDQRRISGQTAPVTAADVERTLSALTGKGYELAYYGGSFTALPVEEQESLLDAAQPFLRDGTLRALRVSTRPDAIDLSALVRLRAAGVETVELGAQSMDDAVLRAGGRGHGAADTERAARLVRDGGFHLILQMMTGLPGATPESDLDTARRLIALRPDGVRIYPTVILRDTPLEALWKSGRYREHTVEDAVSLCARLLPLFEAAGVPVIRLGLNPTEGLSRGGVVGGAYHPAFGELVLSRVWLERARRLLHGAQPGERLTLGVCKNRISQLTGQGRSNLRALETEFQLASLRVVGMDLPDGELRVMQDT